MNRKGDEKKQAENVGRVTKTGRRKKTVKKEYLELQKHGIKFRTCKK
jgi:hypothetical protein